MRGGRIRGTSRNLPPGTHQMYYAVFLPLWRAYLGTRQNPWQMSDNKAMKTMESLWNETFPEHAMTYQTSHTLWYLVCISSVSNRYDYNAHSILSTAHMHTIGSLKFMLLLNTRSTSTLLTINLHYPHQRASAITLCGSPVVAFHSCTAIWRYVLTHLYYHQ